MKSFKQRPTATQIDAMTRRIDRLADAAKPTAKQQLAAREHTIARAELLALVQEFGDVPKSAPCSRRLAGVDYTLTATTGTCVSEHPEAVAELLETMRRNRHEALFTQLFTPRTRYDRARDAANTLRSANLSARLRELFQGIFDRTATEIQRAPVLRIDRAS